MVSMTTMTLALQISTDSATNALLQKKEVSSVNSFYNMESVEFINPDALLLM